MDIFDLKISFISFGPTSAEVSIQPYTVEDLRFYNQGHPEFVSSVLSAITQDTVYDDSDPDAYLGKADFCYYVPTDKVLLDGKPIQELQQQNQRLRQLVVDLVKVFDTDGDEPYIDELLDDAGFPSALIVQGE